MSLDEQIKTAIKGKNKRRLERFVAGTKQPNPIKGSSSGNAVK